MSGRPALPEMRERQELLRVARHAIRDHLMGRELEISPGPPALGVFVTLWAPGHQLRGCVGRMAPISDDLHREVAGCAVAAAVRDPRFPPLRISELDDIDIEISLLGPEEEVSSLEELDPRRYGVVVRHGGRSGVLLPEVEGVDTAREQVAIALRKGGISPAEGFTMTRFEVAKIRPEGAHPSSLGAEA